ncbi:hypothetical protein ACWDTP_04695 [Mycobacterium sp. NPDC003449]
MPTLTSLEKCHTLTTPGPLQRRAAGRRARAQAAQFGSFDEAATRALVAQLNADTASLGRRIAILSCLAQPEVNTWATMIRGALPTLEVASPSLCAGALTEAGRISRWGRETQLHVHDARVFVNAYVPHPPHYSSIDHLYVDTVVWHAGRQQWEMPYSYNEHLSSERNSEQPTSQTRPAGPDPETTGSVPLRR